MRIFLIAISLSALLSCGPELPDSQQLIDQMLEDKISSFEAQKKAECKEKALDDAEMHVDSIVLRLLNLDLVDTLNFPSKPTRPSAPDHIIGTVPRFENLQ